MQIQDKIYDKSFRSLATITNGNDIHNKQKKQTKYVKCMLLSNSEYFTNLSYLKQKIHIYKTKILPVVLCWSFSTLVEKQGS
jgi:hypothetical protein